MKKCTKCKINKDNNEFSFKNEEKNIRQSQCKLCISENDKERYLKNLHNRKTKIRKRAINELHKVKEYYREYKKKQKCTKCGDKRWYVLDFHHINDDKIMEISLIVKRGSMNRLKNELKKCIPLCSNCHRELHFLKKNGAVVDEVITLD